MYSEPIIQPCHVFEGHTARIFSLALCTLRNGNRIAASASHDRTVRIWCLQTNTCLRTIEYSDFVWRVFLVTTAVGRVCVVAFVSTEDKIHVTEFETGESCYVISGRLVYAGVISLYNSPVIVTLINDVDLAIVDVETGKYLRYIRSGFEKAFRAVVSHGSRPLLVFNTWNAQNRRSSIQAYDLYLDNATPEEQAILPINQSNPCLDPIVSNSYWNRFTGECRDEAFIPEKMKIVFEGDSRDGITSLVISQAHKPTICSGHYDNVVRVWDLATLQLLLLLEGHADWVVSVTIWKGVEPIVVSGSSDGTIKVWDLQTGSLMLTCEGHMRDVWAVTVTTGPKPLIVSASSDRTVRTWDINKEVMDIKWARRRSFCMFLCTTGLQPRPSRHNQLQLQQQQELEADNFYSIDTCDVGFNFGHTSNNNVDSAIADLSLVPSQARSVDSEDATVNAQLTLEISSAIASSSSSSSSASRNTTTTTTGTACCDTIEGDDSIAITTPSEGTSLTTTTTTGIPAVKGIFPTSLDDWERVLDPVYQASIVAFGLEEEFSSYFTSQLFIDSQRALLESMNCCHSPTGHHYNTPISSPIARRTNKNKSKNRVTNKKRHIVNNNINIITNNKDGGPDHMYYYIDENEEDEVDEENGDEAFLSTEDKLPNPIYAENVFYSQHLCREIAKFL